MKYQYWLANITGIGNVTKRRLLGSMGDARAIYEADKAVLLATGLLREEIAEYVQRQKEAWRLEEEYGCFLEKRISFVTMESPEYPDLLRDIYNAPYALYYHGTLPGQTERILAMVGARRCSAYGRTIAEEIAAALGKAGYGVSSGMALGIDGASHRGCIRGGGRTYAFLGCGVDVIYPARHDALYRQIIENGAVLSDFAPGTEPLAVHFPSRNRLISGIAEKTLVIEARKRSGSLITADTAMEQGRDVLALPGRITDTMSEGTNHLIAQGAGIISGIEQLLADLDDLAGLDAIPSKGNAAQNLNLEKEELLVYSCFDFYAKGLEDVRKETGLELLPMLSAVMRLTELGLIRETFKNQYIRLE